MFVVATDGTQCKYNQLQPVHLEAFMAFVTKYSTYFTRHVYVSAYGEQVDYHQGQRLNLVPLPLQNKYVSSVCVIYRRHIY
jgi:hypothetical protein